MLTLPNVLTLARIVVIPVMVALFYIDAPAARWVNGTLFIAAAITDFFDGWLARRSNQVSRLGRFLDPIADKLLVAAVLMMLVGVGHISPWSYPAAVVILMREILVSGLREFLAEIQVIMPVTRLAKWKTTVQLVALAVLILGPLPGLGLPVSLLGELLLWVAATMTLITGYDYLRLGLRYMGPEHDQPAPPKKSGAHVPLTPPAPDAPPVNEGPGEAAPPQFFVILALSLSRPWAGAIGETMSERPEASAPSQTGEETALSLLHSAPLALTHFMTWQKRIVTSLLRTRDLQTTLETLVHLIEDLNPGVLCTVMRLSDNRLFFAAGPSFPDFYHEAVDGVEIGEGVGSCGTAAFRGETVIVENLYSHPYWANFRGLMSAVGVASCWSEPVRTHEGRILGTFALYRRKPHIPSAQELEQIKVFADLTAIFMEFCAADQTRQITEQRLLHVVADIPGALYEFRLTRDGTMSLPFLSEGIRRLTGHALGPVVPDARALLMNIATGDRRAALLDSILHSAQTLTPWASDLPLPGDDGPRWLRCEARPRRHPDGSVVWAGVMTDITRDKQKAQQDHATTTALAQTNAALEGFVTTAAEDLSDPLRMIAGFLALLRRRLAPVMDEETREVIDFAVENAQRLEDHVGTLLAYTQSQNEPEAVVALDTVLAESLTLLCTRHPRVNERLRVETPLPSVVGRKTQLILVFQAVLEAFLRPPFTGVTLRTREGESDWEITFASADLRVSGDLPLGLAMARHILTAHQGSLSLEAGRATLRLLKKGEG